MAATDKRSAGDAPSRSIGAVMDEAKTIVVYTDYKSPYAYLAKDLIYRLEDEFRVRLDWLPYTLDIPSYLGSARLDERGEVVESERSPHQWRRVRYSYMDCRRQARKRGLVILGTRKIWDSSTAAIGMLWAKRQGTAAFRAYHDRVFERFWRRDLDIEDARVVAAVLAETGADATGFNDFLAGDGRREHDAIRAAAETAGVFGVPTLLVDGELFWGREHLPDIREMLAPLARSGADSLVAGTGARR
jgi:2-hydroxychromene-2-carboxylate isomerase